MVGDKMKCPYCGVSVDTSTSYCANCGQPLDIHCNISQSSDYWKNVNSENKALEDKNREIQRKVINERNTQIKRKTTKFISIAISIVLCFAIFIGIKNSNQDKLKQYHKSIIGNTYGDNKETTFRIGQNVERSVVEIIDEDTLYFKSGIFSTSFEQKSTVNSFIVTGTTIYTKVDVSKPVSYKYSLSISITGKVTISFNGKTYPVDIEDGNIQGIDMY